MRYYARWTMLYRGHWETAGVQPFSVPIHRRRARENVHGIPHFVKGQPMIQRKIVQIDEEKCDGCGLCVPACEEGAIRIVGGKARLVSDVYCDGLGACLGHCPRDAITIVERDSLPFNEDAVAQHLSRLRATASGLDNAPANRSNAASLPVYTDRQQAVAPRQAAAAAPSLGCPGSRAMSFGAQAADMSDRRLPPGADAAPEPSRLANWPVQLHLVPPHAPYLRNADLLLVADCVPFACAGFHRRFLQGQPVVIGCPKLDDSQFYVEKLKQIIATAGIRSIHVLHMEVPCCLGLVHIARAAIQASGTDVPLEDTTISLRGEVLSRPGATVRCG